MKLLIYCHVNNDKNKISMNLEAEKGLSIKNKYLSKTEITSS